ncbi:Gluconate 5-dehydrogenase [bioreactor metagenome]|uniref:Gluconate 5-dehydrogenase n=2 Tax=root TaxID=1 RepID=A0A645CC59_9ZZZZ
MIGENLEKIFSLERKVIVLTGATGGIGSALAKGLASVGAEMVLCGTSMEKLSMLQEEIENFNGKAKGFVLDIGNMDSIKQCVKDINQEYAKIDVLINCAGINKREGFLDVEEETYDKIMDVNLKGLFFFSQEIIKIMIEAKSGNIINIASHNSF